MIKGNGRIIIGALLTLAIGLIMAGCKGTSADETISTNVKSAFAKDTILKDSNLSVDTEDGVVTLSGMLRTEGERTRAVEMARQTGGVVRVVDKLDVDSEATRSSADKPASDTDKKDYKGGGVVQGTKDLALEAELKTKFAASKDVSASDLDIDVKDGVVTLSAEQGKHPNLKKAAEIARGTGGVKSVIIK